jgi:aspartyl-tRNA(Asn)/glutamyl-tRNA(Gln) amidotransferase subunit C
MQSKKIPLRILWILHGISTMALTLTDIENVAHLARLQLGEAEKQEALNSITNILAMIDQMQAVDTTGVEPLAHGFDASQRLRDDVVTETNQRDTLLKLAPNAEQGLFLVPKVLE